MVPLALPMLIAAESPTGKTGLSAPSLETVGTLGQNVPKHLAVHIRQAALDAVVVVGEALVVQA